MDKKLIQLDYQTPRSPIPPPVLGLAKWGLFWGIVSILVSVTESGGSINGVATTPTRWSVPGLQGFVCVLALWINWRALKQIKRSAIPLGGKPQAIVGACLAGVKLLLLWILY